MATDIREMAKLNCEKLSRNPYPGRGIILGTSPDSNSFVQIYWIMGRSENSRNRVFQLEDNGFVRTKAFEESKVVDPSLIIYYPAKHLDRCHIISNGDQTDTVFAAMQKGKEMEYALQLREFEPDAPNFTPRITGIMDMMESHSAYRLSILKTFGNDATCGCYRQNYSFEKALPGIGHCITTYQGDGDPLPSFSGDPLPVEILGTPSENMDYYWSLLNPENRVSLMVKWINRLTFEAKTIVINKHQ
jgi:hypothetical protein